MFEYILLLIRKVYHYPAEYNRKRRLRYLVRNGLRLGKNVCIVSNYYFDNPFCYLVSIGDNCTICANVQLLAHDASTKKMLGYVKLGKIDIKENCFIGQAVIVLPGVTIGPDSIVGAGSVVTHDIPPNTIAAGNPAKVIFSKEDYIRKIQEISKNKKIFDRNYNIDSLDNEKRLEIIKSIGDSLGFIK